MQHHEFIAAVQQRAELASPGDAEIATRATLQTLTERLAGGLPENLGSQLPEELGRHLEQTGGGEAPDYGLTEFLQRVAERHDGAVSREDAAARTGWCIFIASRCSNVPPPATSSPTSTSTSTTVPTIGLVTSSRALTRVPRLDGRRR